MNQKFYLKLIIVQLLILFLGGIFLIFSQNGEAKENEVIRKVLIVPQGQLEKGIEMARELGIPEVAEGIPSALKGKVTENMLPYVYEETIYETEAKLPNEIQEALEEKGADIAEYYPVADESIEAGDVVAISNSSGLIIANTETKYLVEKASQPYDQKIIGVISGNSAMVISSGDNSNPEIKKILRPIALTGRVKVKVSLENGPIKIGDYLTSSSLPGVAMRATKAGKTIGTALENFDGTTDQEIKIGPDGSPITVGKIMIFVNVDWYGGEIKGEENSSSNKETLSNIFSLILEQFKKLGVFIEQNLVRLKRLVISALVIEKGPVPEENTIGEGVILSGTKEVTIYNKNVKPTSKIFITFREDYGGRWWASEIGDGYFKISLSDLALRDLPFDYWIIEVGGEVLEGNLESLPKEKPSGQEQPSNCQPTEEICDQIDNDCDGEIDEGGVCETTPESTPESTPQVKSQPEQSPEQPPLEQ